MLTEEQRKNLIERRRAFLKAIEDMIDEKSEAVPCIAVVTLISSEGELMTNMTMPDDGGQIVKPEEMIDILDEMREAIECKIDELSETDVDPKPVPN